LAKIITIKYLQMNNVTANSKITSTTTTTAVNITFSKEGAQYTAEFTVTSIWDRETDYTMVECCINNQINMPALTDDEDAILWAMAKSGIPC